MNYLFFDSHLSAVLLSAGQRSSFLNIYKAFDFGDRYLPWPWEVCVCLQMIMPEYLMSSKGLWSTFAAIHRVQVSICFSYATYKCSGLPREWVASTLIWKVISGKKTLRLSPENVSAIANSYTVRIKMTAYNEPVTHICCGGCPSERFTCSFGRRSLTSLREQSLWLRVWRCYRHAVRRCRNHSAKHRTASWWKYPDVVYALLPQSSTCYLNTASRLLLHSVRFDQ